MGMVKTAHKEFPSKYPKRWTIGALPSKLEPPSRGDHVLLTSKQDGDALPLFALFWGENNHLFQGHNIARQRKPATATQENSRKWEVRYRPVLEGREATRHGGAIF